VGATGHGLEALAGAVAVVGLAEEAAVEGDVGVDGEDDAPSPDPLRRRPRLPAGVLDDEVGGRSAVAELLDLGDDDLELDPERRQQLAPARRR
jgi:hypothetical protein